MPESSWTFRMNGSFCFTMRLPVSDGLSMARIFGSCRMASATRTAPSISVMRRTGESFAVSARRIFVTPG